MRVALVALNASYMHVSLAARQLMPALAGFDAHLIEGHINLPHRRLLENILRGGPDVVAFSCYIWNIGAVLRLARSIKRARPEASIILGGPEVGPRADDVLAAHPEVDHVVVGEGEAALPALLREIRDRTARRGAAHGPRLDPADWVDAYAGGVEGLEDRILYIETSRGCPYGCQFCLSSAEPGVQALGAAESLRRLTALADGGARLIKLVDRTFNFHPARAREIWAGLIEHADRTGYPGTYHFEIGAHLISDADIGALRRARRGLFQFEVGVQSSDAGVLENVRRAAPFDAIARGARRVAALGSIHLHVDLIAGLPGDDIVRFAKSLDDAFALGAEVVQLGFLKLLHGSGLRRDAAELGITFEPDAPYEVLSTPRMRFDELCHLKDVETVLNWYHNSRLYRCGLRYLLRGRSPFTLFSSLAAAYRAAGAFDAERGERARAALLLAQFPGDGALAALVRHDLLRAGRRRDLPEALAFAETGAQRALLRERFHPVRGQSAYEYPIDVEAFERTGEVIISPSLVVYP